MRSDEELIQAVAARDESAFDALFARHHGALRSRVLRIVRSEAVADDLVQEAFLRAWRRAEQYDRRGAVKAWLLRIGQNLALNHLRSARRSRQQPLEAPPPGPDDRQAEPDWMIDPTSLGPDEIVELAERGERLQRMIDDLPEDRRRLWGLVHEDEMDLRAVAEELGIPLGTAKSRLHYTRKKLRQAFKDLQPDWEDLE